MSLQVEVAKTAGFCFGVDRAVSAVYRLLEEGKRAATLGPIIHNPQVTGDLEAKGVRAVSSPEETPPGCVLVIRSHGVPQATMDRIRELGLPFEDATCPFVKKIHDLARQAGEEGRFFLLFGDEKHPEVQGIVGHCTGALRGVQRQAGAGKTADRAPKFSENARGRGRPDHFSHGRVANLFGNLEKSMYKTPRYLLQYVMQLRNGKKRLKTWPGAAT